jgi:hypothetical protein
MEVVRSSEPNAVEFCKKKASDATFSLLQSWTELHTPCLRNKKLKKKKLLDDPFVKLSTIPFFSSFCSMTRRLLLPINGYFPLQD